MITEKERVYCTIILYKLVFMRNDLPRTIASETGITVSTFTLRTNCQMLGQLGLFLYSASVQNRQVFQHLNPNFYRMCES